MATARVPQSAQERVVSISVEFCSTAGRVISRDFDYTNTDTDTLAQYRVYIVHAFLAVRVVLHVAGVVPEHKVLRSRYAVRGPFGNPLHCSGLAVCMCVCCGRRTSVAVRVQVRRERYPHPSHQVAQGQMRRVVAQRYQRRRVRVREDMRNLHASVLYTLPWGRPPHIREVSDSNLGGAVLHWAVEAERIHLPARSVRRRHQPPWRVHRQVSGDRRVALILQSEARPGCASGPVRRADHRVVRVEGEDIFGLSRGYDPALRFCDPTSVSWLVRNTRVEETHWRAARWPARLCLPPLCRSLCPRRY